MKAAAGADVTDPDIVVAELAGLTVSAVADVPLGDAPDTLAGLAVGCVVRCLASGCAADPVAAAWLVLDPVPDWLAGLTVPAVADVPLCDAPDAPTGLAAGCAVCCGLASGCTADSPVMTGFLLRLRLLLLRLLRLPSWMPCRP